MWILELPPGSLRSESRGTSGRCGVAGTAGGAGGVQSLGGSKNMFQNGSKRSRKSHQHIFPLETQLMLLLLFFFWRFKTSHLMVDGHLSRRDFSWGSPDFGEKVRRAWKLVLLTLFVKFLWNLRVEVIWNLIQVITYLLYDHSNFWIVIDDFNPWLYLKCAVTWTNTAIRGMMIKATYFWDPQFLQVLSTRSYRPIVSKPDYMWNIYSIYIYIYIYILACCTMGGFREDTKYRCTIPSGSKQSFKQRMVGSLLSAKDLQFPPERDDDWVIYHAFPKQQKGSANYQQEEDRQKELRYERYWSTYYWTFWNLHILPSMSSIYSN